MIAGKGIWGQGRKGISNSVRLLAVLVAFAPFLAKGQDPSYSQAVFNPVYLNPAFTGSNYGLKATMATRNQWRNINGRFNTHFLSLEIAEGCVPIAIGLNALQDNEGYNNLKTTKAGFSLGWHGKLKRQLDMSGGLGFNYYHKSIDWDGLVFSNQLDPVQGNIYPSGVKTPEVLDKSFLDLEGGVAFHFSKYVQNNRKIITSTGISMHHANKPDEGLIGVSRLPRRVNVQVISDIPIPRSWKTQGYFIPYFFYSWQDVSKSTYARQSEVQFGANSYMRPIVYGIGYHSGRLPLLMKNTNELSLMVGYQQPFSNSKKAWQITYSYDFPLTSLSNSTFGSHEITLQIFFDNVKIFCRGGIENKCDLRTGGIPQIYSR